MAQNPTADQILRKFLNPNLKGKFIDALVKALATGDAKNEANLLAVKDQISIATATGQYLEKLLSQIGIVKPPQTGIDDDTLRELAIAQTSTKLVTNIFLQILEAFYGADAVRANVLNTVQEPYALADGMQLYIKVDDLDTPIAVTFQSEDFSSIAAATALEVANAISRAALNQGYTLSADEYLDNTSGNKYVQLFSGTRGPKSSIRVLGGQAQNILQFPTLLPTTQNIGTQFTLSISGGNIRFTWTSGADPGLGSVEVDDYVNIFGSGFSATNRGTFTIKAIQNGTVTNAYFEIENPNFVAQAPVTLGTVSDVMFFSPTRLTLSDLARKASIYEVNPYEIVALMPVTTKIVKRKLNGSAHLNVSTTGDQFIGSYIYSPNSGFNIASVQTKITQTIDAGQIYSVLSVSNANAFPDAEGYLVFEYGYDEQEGPVKYIGKSSSTGLLLDPSYKFKKSHAANVEVNLLRSTAPLKPKADASDYPFYITDSIQGRLQAEILIRQLTASGIFLNVVIVVPNGVGLTDVNFDYGVT